MRITPVLWAKENPPRTMPGRALGVDLGGQRGSTVVKAVCCVAESDWADQQILHLASVIRPDKALLFPSN
jgi:hypothetical protein